MDLSGEDTIEAEEDGDIFASEDDILDGKSCLFPLRKKARMHYFSTEMIISYLRVKSAEGLDSQVRMII